MADLHDPSYLQMNNDIKRQDSISGTTQWTDSDTLLKQDTMMKEMAIERVRVEILGQLMFLLALLKQYPSLAPETYFCEQVNSGSAVIIKIVNLLKDYHGGAISLMLSEVFSEVYACIGNRGLVVAVDEATCTGHTIWFGLSFGCL